MLRRSFLGIVALAVLWTVTLAAQVKELPKTPVRPLNAKIVDINTAPERTETLPQDALHRLFQELASLGVEIAERGDPS